MRMIICQIILFVTAIFVFVMISVWNYRLKCMKKKLEIEQEKSNNMKIILDKYLNQHINDSSKL